MWLIFDIGNSTIKAGFFENGLRARRFSMRSDPHVSVAAYRHTLHARLMSMTPDRIGIISVVPKLTDLIAEALRAELMIVPEFVRWDMELPLEMGYRTPQTLGMDRLAAACAAVHLYGKDERGVARSVVVVDAGTAVTVDAVDASGLYRGGAILPGPAAALSGLSRGTARLPEVPMILPKRAIGRSTTKALQSGVMFGFIDSVSGMLGRVKRQVRRTPFVVATGGWAAMLAREIPEIDRVEEDLVLYGGRLLLEMNPQDRQF